MFARVFEQCVAEMGAIIPRAYQSGPGQPLHAYVRYADDGGERNESQESRREQIETAPPLLYEQGMHPLYQRKELMLLRLRAENMVEQNVLFIVCALNELFFIALYLLSFSSPTLSPSLLPTDKSPGSSSQPGSPSHPASTFFAAPGSAWAMELARANKMDSTWPWIFAAISFPVMAAKQILNVVQLVKASKWLAEGDIKTRKEQGLPRKKNN